MANIRVIQSPYIGPFSNVEAVVEASNTSGVGIHVGELGGRVELTQTGSGTKEYQKVQLDSGAVAAAASGAPTLGELVYWKDKSKYLVTNDSRFAVGGQTTNGWRNEVAGVIVASTTALAAQAGLAPYIWVQQKGNNTAVKISSGSPNPGDKLISDTSTVAAQGTIVPAGNAAPVVMELGRFALAQVTVTSATVDLDIPGIP